MQNELNAINCQVMKRKKNISPTVLTMNYLRKRGVDCSVVEKWIKFGRFGVRRDCFGFDILCLLGDKTMGCQAGAGSMHSAKVKHAIDHPDVLKWLSSEHRIFQVWTFSKRVVFNADGKKSKTLRWTPRVTEIYREGNALFSRPFILS